MDTNQLARTITRMRPLSLILFALAAASLASAAAGTLNLPAGQITATQSFVAPGSFFATALSGVGAGFDITNVTYPGWCGDSQFAPVVVTQLVKAYSTYSATLPANAQNPAWPKVNHVLNNKIGTPDEIQAAIWILLNGFTTFDVTPNVTAMVNAANANPGFVPGEGQTVAVLLYVDGFAPEGPVQDTIIEVPLGGAVCATAPGGVDLGGLNNYLFFFANGSTDANWQGASKGFVGNVVINGVVAAERTSGSFAYAGKISTSDSTLGAWQSIVNNNPGQASASTGQSTLAAQMETALRNAFTQINGLAVTPGFESRSAVSLNGLNKQNGTAETVVINVTSGLSINSQIEICGDARDTFILRWDTDANFANGYQGQVKFQSGGAIVPKCGLKAGNFVHVAGDINASGGGGNPPLPYPQGPRLNEGLGSLITNASNFNGGGFFTGYWLTTGNSKGETAPLSNGIFVGGWYSLTAKFSMTSGASGVHVCPAP